MKSIWNSKMENSLKIIIFKVTIEPILLHGSEYWTINSIIRKKIDVYYTRRLIMATNISWKEKVTIVIIYIILYYIIL